MESQILEGRAWQMQVSLDRRVVTKLGHSQQENQTDSAASRNIPEVSEK